MRRFNMKVIDDYVVASLTNPVYTKENLNTRLGAYDLLAIMIVVDNVDAATGTINVQVQHSSDGRLWIDKTKHCTGAGNASAVDITGTIDNTKQWAFWGKDLLPNPSLELVRLKIWFSGSTTKGHIRVFTTARDRAAMSPVRRPAARRIGGVPAGRAGKKIKLSL